MYQSAMSLCVSSYACRKKNSHEVRERWQEMEDEGWRMRETLIDHSQPQQRGANYTDSTDVGVCPGYLIG